MSNAKEIRYPKHEIRNKFKTVNSKHETNTGFSFEHSPFHSFQFVSCFVLRASCLAFLASVARAEFPRVPPTPPDRAESTFEVQHNFKMDLIAAEPLICSPVD